MDTVASNANAGYTQRQKGGRLTLRIMTCLRELHVSVSDLLSHTASWKTPGARWWLHATKTISGAEAVSTRRKNYCFNKAYCNSFCAVASTLSSSSSFYIKEQKEQASCTSFNLRRRTTTMVSGPHRCQNTHVNLTCWCNKRRSQGCREQKFSHLQMEHVERWSP